MNRLPETRYAKSGDVNVAYQVVGDGPRDLVFVPGWVSNIELAWHEPRLEHFQQRLASFSRLIMFDKRGTGLSDRVSPDRLPTLEQRTDDMRAVMDAAGSQRAVIFGVSEGASMCILFAATYPERAQALITFGAFAKRIRALDYPWAPTLEDRLRWVESVERDWGLSSEADLGTVSPSLAGDDRFGRWWATYRRQSASPGAAGALARMNTYIDIRDILPAVRVPTLVLHRTGDRDASIDEGRYIAARIPAARFVELPGVDHIPFVGNQDLVLDEIVEFVTGARPPLELNRVLATVLFTDIVDSTRRAAELGDRGWRELVESHHTLVRAELARFRGTEWDTAGDSFYASFDGPARAARCALAIREAVRGLGIEVRAGVHTGECEEIAGKLGGIATIIGARVKEKAAAGEVLATSTVRDLVSGSGLQFDDRGTHALKGVPGEWRLYSLA